MDGGCAERNETPLLPRRWQQARDCVCASILAGGRLVLLTGPHGAGKTMLLQDAARVLRFAGWDVALQVAPEPHDEPQQADSTRHALLIDDADRLPAPELHQLVAARRGSLLLAGSESLSSLWPDSVRIRLDLLGPDEAREFTALWLAQAGLPSSHLTEDGLVELISLSGGRSKLLASLLATAIRIADTAGAAQVSRGHVNGAAALRACFLEPEHHPPPHEEPPAQAVEPAPAPSPIQPEPSRRHYGLAVAASVFAALTVLPIPSSEPPHASLALPQLVAALIPAPVPAIVPQAEAASSQLKPAAARLPNPDIIEIARVQPEGPDAGRIDPAMADSPPQFLGPPPSPAPIADLASVEVLPPWPPAQSTVTTQPDPEVAATATNVEDAKPLAPALVDLLIRRGHEMLSLGDVSAARLLFGRAAASGSAEAMLAMGRTFDPALIGSVAPRAAPDTQAAAHWYGLAAALGNGEAASLLQRIGRRASR